MSNVGPRHFRAPPKGHPMQNASLVAPKLLSTKELAAYLGVAPRTIHDWRCRAVDTPPAIKLPGGKLRWQEQDVQRWLAQRAEAGASV